MGEAEIRDDSIIIHSVFFFYGNEATDVLSKQIAKDIADHWNQPNAVIRYRRKMYRVVFDILGNWAPALTPLMVYENVDPRNNYFRIENYAYGNISFVDGLNCNTGYFLLDNLLNNSTTAAHEYGHTLGLDHPVQLDIRGKGVPGIMYPRGTWTDPEFQYSPVALPGHPGGTMNPFNRKVTQHDVDALKIHRLDFDRNGFAVIGGFSSVWHQAHDPQQPLV